MDIVAIKLCGKTPVPSMVLMVSVLLLAGMVAATSRSPSMFPVEIFGNDAVQRHINKDLPSLGAQQQIIEPAPVPAYEIDHGNLRYSNSSFRGDETGDSPFFYCPESDPENDLFAIDKMVLNPNPPHISYVFVFHAHGFWREDIIDSRYPFRVTCTVRREDREGIDFSCDRDFCDFIDMLEMDGKSTICPPFKGNGTVHKFEFVDWGISEGNYSLKIDVRGNGKRVFCVQSWFDLTNKLI